VEESEQEEPKAKVKKDKVATKTIMVQFCKCKTLRMWRNASGKGWSCVDCKITYACKRVDAQMGIARPAWSPERLANWRSNLSSWNVRKGVRSSKPAHLDVEHWRCVLAERNRLANLIDKSVADGRMDRAAGHMCNLETLLSKYGTVQSS
jgi:hypothetical protein